MNQIEYSISENEKLSSDWEKVLIYEGEETGRDRETIGNMITRTAWDVDTYTALYSRVVTLYNILE